MPAPLVSAFIEDEPRQIPTPPSSYRFEGHVLSSTLPGISTDMSVTGVLRHSSSLSSTDGLPYSLTVIIDGWTFSSSDYQMESHLYVDTRDLLARQHQMIPQLPGYEGHEFGLRFFASGAKWTIIVHGVLRSPDQPPEELIVSGKIDQFTELDELTGHPQ